ncbi:hypothetical protein CHCC20493_1924 [Bacillus licheniformis]|nr:hypothetical protein CHCC20493_1924 [Bacillus licheniformis]
MYKKEIEKLISSYHWMAKEVQRLQRVLYGSDIPMRSWGVAQYGLEAAMPKGSPGKSQAELKADHKTLEQRVITLERASDRHDQQIMSINDKLNKIEENTTWIKRSITGAIITAVCTLVISGIAALFINFIQK